MCENISFDYVLDESIIKTSEIKNILPNWKTKIQEIIQLKSPNDNNNIQMKCCIKATNIEEIKEWIQAYEERTNSTFSIKSTEKTSGKYVVFKQRLYCHHNTKCARTYEAYKKTGTRNTNCPANINITLRAVKKVYRGKDPSKAPDPEMPCEIILHPIHNHETRSADALRFQAVSGETKAKLLELYKHGHTAASALESLKMAIQLNNDDYEKILANRKYCPDYAYCYYLFMTEFKKKYGPVEISRELLNKHIADYNKETNENSVQAVFEGSDYVICICPPLFRRVHKHIKSASEVVFMDSSGTVNNDGSRVFILLTHAACGALPLAVMITSSESTNIISTGLSLLKSMAGDVLFGGNSDGPNTFMTDDSIAEQNAIRSVFKNSKILLCIFHVLQSVWRWLVKARNGIKRDDQVKLFLQFRAIMYANSTCECELKYKEALDEASRYPNYINYLNDYYNRKELWALAYRGHLLIRGHNTNNNSEAAMRLLKDKIFQRTKAYNLIQTVDFILTKFISYYQRRLLDAAYNRSRKNIFDHEIKLPPPGILEKIQTISDHIHLVPSETTHSLFYIVNTHILLCTCPDGKTGKICKHIHWACSTVYSELYVHTIDNTNLRKKLYQIALGSEPAENWLIPLYSQNKTTQIADESTLAATIVPMEIDTSIPSSSGNQLAQADLMLENKQLVEEIALSFMTYSERSPLEVGIGLRKMKENLAKLRTVSAFTSACSTFASEFRRIHRRSSIPVQPTAIGRRRTALTGKACNVGGRPRKGTPVLKIKNRLLIDRIKK